MGRLIVAALVLIMFCSTANGQTDGHAHAEHSDTHSTADSHVPKLSMNSQREQRIHMRLEEPIELSFDDSPWSEIEAELERQLDCSIVLTRSASDDALSADEPITCDLRNVSGKTAIRNMLERRNATMIVDDGVVKIISLDDVEDVRYFSNHFIDVRQLLLTIETRDRQVGQPRLVGLAEIAGINTPESLLIDLIQSSCYQDQWRESGQGLATIKIMGGCAVVYSNNQLVDQLRDFLGDLSHHLAKK